MKKNTLIFLFSLLLLLVPLSLFAAQFCQPENILATAPLARYESPGKGLVSDKETGLMWRQCVEGVNGEACDNGAPVELTWAEALLYPGSINKGGLAGFSDWRIPNIRELSTLAELQCVTPAMNLQMFVNAPSSHVWSSSPYHFYTHYSWYVDFNNGAATYDERIVKKHLRLVRDLK